MKSVLKTDIGRQAIFLSGSQYPRCSMSIYSWCWHQTHCHIALARCIHHRITWICRENPIKWLHYHHKDTRVWQNLLIKSGGCHQELTLSGRSNQEAVTDLWGDYNPRASSNIQITSCSTSMKQKTLNFEVIVIIMVIICQHKCTLRWTPYNTTFGPAPLFLRAIAIIHTIHQAGYMSVFVTW